MTTVKPITWANTIPKNVTNLDTESLEKKFMTYLNNEKSFYSENISKVSLKKLNYISFMDIIVELNNRSYIFTQDQFDKFIICATYRKTQSWIVKRGYLEAFKNPQKYLSVIKIFFDKFTPTKAQINKLCECYKVPKLIKKKYWNARRLRNRQLASHKKKLHYVNWSWVSYIIKNKHNINTYNIILLLRLGCDMIIPNYDMKNISPSLFEYFCKYSNLGLSSDRIKDINFIPTEKAIINFLKSVNDVGMVDRNLNHVNTERILSLLRKVKVLTDPIDNQLQIFYHRLYDNYSLKMMIFEYLLNIGHIPIFNKKNIYFIIFNYSLDCVLKAYYSKKCEITIQGINLLLYNMVLYDIDDLYMGISIKSKYPECDKFIVNNRINLYKFAVHIGLSPDLQTLNYCTKHGMYKEITEIINNYNIKPNSETLSYAIKSKCIKLIDYIVSFRVPFDELVIKSLLYTIRYSSKNVGKEMFEYFVKNGLEINYRFIDILLQLHTYNYIKKYLEYYPFLNDLSFYGLKYSDELYYVMHKNNSFPKIWTDKLIIDKKILTLRDMCKKKKIKLEDILEYEKSNKVNIDMYCIENAYISKNNDLINYFINNYEFKYTLRCLSSSKSDNNIYDNLCDRLGINYEFMKSNPKKINI